MKRGECAPETSERERERERENCEHHKIFTEFHEHALHTCRLALMMRLSITNKNNIEFDMRV